MKNLRALAGTGLRELLAIAFLLATLSAFSNAGDNSSDIQHGAAYRGPIDLVLSDDEAWVVTANELSSTLSLVDLKTREVVDEVRCEARPAAIARLPGDQLLVSCRDGGSVQRFAIDRASAIDSGARKAARLRLVASIETGFQPLGIAVDKGGERAYVGLVAAGEVAEIDLQLNSVVRRLSVGLWPRYLALSPDGARLAVGLSGESKVAVVDVDSGETVYDEPISGGINMGHMSCSSDGQYVYFPWMIYRTNPITVNNIRRGWVLASRLARVRLDGPSYREAISLDVPRLAVADPHGLAITPDESRIAVTSSGTHELLVYRLADLPFVGAGGPGDLIDDRLLRDQDRFYRIELGGRPMGVHPGRDSRLVFVANHTSDLIQIVDLESRRVLATIPLGSQPAEQQLQLAHRGLEIFHDAGRSLDQWYSCHSCHFDGGSNAKAMDTWNDGTELTVKTVLPLIGVTETGPWTWHGWQGDLDESIQNSLVSTMQGVEASAEDVSALRAYLASLTLPKNPFLKSGDADFSEAVERGRKLFSASEVGCSGCHAGPRFTDGEIHDVGLGGESDKYEGFNTPSLIGVYQKVRLLHDGRSKSLKDVLTNWHSPSEIGGGAELSDQQINDLVAYLKTL